MIAELVRRARIAQKAAYSMTQERVDKLAAAIVFAVSREDTATRFAQMAMDDTKFGKLEDRAAKLRNKLPALFYDIKDQKSVGIIERNKEKGLIKIAKPHGVIAGLIPSTHPIAVVAAKGVLSLRGRNAIIFAPHPGAVPCSIAFVEYLRDLLKQNGAPEDLFQVIHKPSKPAAAELMAQCNITVATGSGDMVRAAYSSGKPAYGVGAGNAPAVITESADPAKAAKDVFIGKTFDYATGCAAENSVVIQKSVYEKTVGEMKKLGGYLCNADEKAKLQAFMWPDGEHLSRQVVGQAAPVIAKLAGFSVPGNTAFIMVEETGWGKGYPFSSEKLSVVLTVYKYGAFQEAIDTVNGILNHVGNGHSLAIHSAKEDEIMQLSMQTTTSRVLVNQFCGGSSGGNWHNGLANTYSLGCGIWGGNIVSENLTQKHFYQFTLVSEPISRKPATEQEIFGDLLKGMKGISSPSW
jgi:sulfoacetaldehyde dehydrogenase